MGRTVKLESIRSDYANIWNFFYVSFFSVEILCGNWFEDERSGRYSYFYRLIRGVDYIYKELNLDKFEIKILASIELELEFKFVYLGNIKSHRLM